MRNAYEEKLQRANRVTKRLQDVRVLALGLLKCEQTEWSWLVVAAVLFESIPDFAALTQREPFCVSSSSPSQQNGLLQKQKSALETKLKQAGVAASGGKDKQQGSSGADDADERYDQLKQEYDQLAARTTAREKALQQMHRLEAQIFEDPSGRTRCTPDRLEELYALRRHAWKAAAETDRQ